MDSTSHDYRNFGTTGVSGIPVSGMHDAPAAGITIITNDSGTRIYNSTTVSWTNIDSQSGSVNVNASNGVMLSDQTLQTATAAADFVFIYATLPANVQKVWGYCNGAKLVAGEDYTLSANTVAVTGSS